MYHKRLKIAISALSLVMAFVMFVQPAKASSVQLDFNEQFYSYCVYNYNAYIDGLYDSVYFDSGTRSIINFEFTTKFNFDKNPYASSLYCNGIIRLGFTININSPSELFAPTFAFETSSNSIDGVTISVPTCYFSNNDNQIIGIIQVYLDNAYALKSRTSLGDIDFNFKMSYFLPHDYVTASLRMGIFEPILSSKGFNVGTSVHPMTTSGQAGIISDAVLFAIEQSYIEENQNTANQNLSTIISWLSTIKAQDLNYYNQIVQKIAEQTANDNRLFEILYNTLQSDLYGDHSLSTPWGEADFHGFAGDLLAQIGVELAYFRMLFNSYARANQTEAEEVNDSASSQEEALNNLADSLAVPTRDFNSNFDSLDNEFSEDIVSDQGRIFFFLNPRYNIIITILVTATSFGLIGFILYGKGG